MGMTTSYFDLSFLINQTLLIDIPFCISVQIESSKEMEEFERVIAEDRKWSTQVHSIDLPLGNASILAILILAIPLKGTSPAWASLSVFKEFPEAIQEKRTKARQIFNLCSKG